MASEDLNTLFEAALAFAEHMLLGHGEFLPFGVQMGSDGGVGQVSVEPGTGQPGAAGLVADLQSAFVEAAHAGTLRAAGICLDMRITPPGAEQQTDAICVRLAHVSGEAVEVFVPYHRDAAGVLHTGQPFAAAAGVFRLAAG